MITNQLNAKVSAVNAAHAYALQIYPVLRKIFAEYVGKKVVRQDNGLISQIKKLLPEFPKGLELRVFSSNTNFSVNFAIKTAVFGTDNGIAYYTYNLPIGRL